NNTRVDARVPFGKDPVAVLAIAIEIPVADELRCRHDLALLVEHFELASFEPPHCWVWICSDNPLCQMLFVWISQGAHHAGSSGVRRGSRLGAIFDKADHAFRTGDVFRRN